MASAQKTARKRVVDLEFVESEGRRSYPTPRKDFAQPACLRPDLVCSRMVLNSRARVDRLLRRLSTRSENACHHGTRNISPKISSPILAIMNYWRRSVVAASVWFIERGRKVLTGQWRSRSLASGTGLPTRT